MLRILREEIESRGLQLDNAQVRVLFGMGVRWEELRRIRIPVGRGGVDKLDTSDERERLRRKYIDGVWKKFVKIKSEESDGMLIERYSNMIFLRSIIAGEEDTLANAVEVYRIAMLRSTPLETPDLAEIGSTFLARLFQQNSSLALKHLHAMLDRRRLPSRLSVENVMNTPASEEDYDEARRVLDSACEQGGNKGRDALERLLESRLKTLDNAKRTEEEPILAFIDWLAHEARVIQGGPSAREWLAVALKLWKTVFVHENAQGVTVISAGPAKAMGRLVKLTCRLEFAYHSTGPGLRQPSPELRLATTLITKYAPHNVLVDRSQVVLLAICCTAPDFALARPFYHALRERAPIDESYPFRWSVSLLPAFAYLFSSAIKSPSIDIPDNPRLAIQLYIDLTADGMTLPKGFWQKLWKALGQRGSVEELARTIGDYEETGRFVESKTVNVIMTASAETGRVLKTLRLYKFLVTRSKRQKMTLMIETHNTMLNVLATTQQDRRSDSNEIIKTLLSTGPTPNIDTWNAVLSNHVIRSVITPEDLAAAGSVYNTILSTKTRPDATTFSLLLHGFLRISTDPAGTTKAIRTFHVAMDAGILPRAMQVSNLIRALVTEKRWEEGKLVSERWWKGVVDQEELAKQNPDASASESVNVRVSVSVVTGKEGESKEEQMKEMTSATERLVRMEEMWHLKAAKRAYKVSEWRRKEEDEKHLLQ